MILGEHTPSPGDATCRRSTKLTRPPRRPPISPRGPRLARLVVGYDGSDGANAAAAFGLWLAGKSGCEATIVHAGPTPESAPSADLLPAAAEQIVAYEREWQWRLGNLREYEADDAASSAASSAGAPPAPSSRLRSTPAPT